jgi:uncharacterized protein (TIGR02996 family)
MMTSISTEEEAFQSLLDLNPSDHTTRLVFADWLEEHDDLRASGYRALGLLRKFPIKGEKLWGWSLRATSREEMIEDCDSSKSIALSLLSLCLIGENKPYMLPLRWYRKLRGHSKRWKNRRQAENAACRAWLKLTDEQRSTILKG